MGARGTNLAVEAHPFPILPAASISGGVSSQPFHLHGAAKLNILLEFSAIAAAEGPVTLVAGTDSTFATSQAISFDVYKQEVTGEQNDVLGPRIAVTAAGYTPAAVANTFDVLHLQADQVPQGYPWLQLRIADGTNADFASAWAVLTGVRYQGESNPTATS